jgi:hypothetical protein
MEQTRMRLEAFAAQMLGGLARADQRTPQSRLRDVQQAASHADPRTTMHYDRARASLDRHATYIVAAYLAGAAR